MLGMIRALKDRKKDALKEIRTLDKAITFYEIMRNEIKSEHEAREVKQDRE